MKLKATLDEARLLLIGIPVLLWTIVPVYHLFLFAISERDSATSITDSARLSKVISLGLPRLTGRCTSDSASNTKPRIRSST